jgi:RHS repeat-associated protein
MNRKIILPTSTLKTFLLAGVISLRREMSHPFYNVRPRRVFGKLGGMIPRAMGAIATIAAIMLVSTVASAQADFEKGFQAYQSYHGSDFDTVNLANGNLILNIPLLSYEQRGGLPPVVISIRSNSTTFQSTPPFQNGPPDTNQHEVSSLVVGSPWGQPHVTISPGGSFWKEERIVISQHGGPGGGPEYLARFVATDESGATHSLGGAIANQVQGYVPGIMYSVDGSGLMLQPASGNNGPLLVDRKGNIGGLIDPNGNAINLQGPCAKPAGGGDFFNPSLGAWEGNAHGIASATTIVDSIGRSIPNPSYLPPVAQYSCLVDLDASYHPANPNGNGCETYDFPGQEGSQVPLIFCYAQHAVSASIPIPSGEQGSFQYETINETWWVLTSVTLPNQTEWVFTYDNYGQVQSVTMPTGATVSYTYQTRLACGNPPGQVPPSGTPVWPYSNLLSSRMVASRTLTLNDGNPAHVYMWQYQSTIGSGWVGSPNSGTVTVTDPNTNETVHVFSLISGAGQPTPVCGPYETTTQYKQGSTSVLKEVDTSYSSTGSDYANPTNFSNYIAVGVFPSQVTTTLGGARGVSGVSGQDQYLYDSYGTYQDYLGDTHPFSFGNLLSASESDWGSPGSGNPGLPLRTTLHTRLWQANWNYYAANLIDLPCIDTVFSGNQSDTQTSCTASGSPPSNQASQTIYAYDQSPSPQGARGNLTAVTRWLSTGSSPVSQTVYSSYGMPIEKIDPLLNPTYITYDNTHLYPNNITHPPTGSVAHVEIPAYDANTGELLSHEDENKNTTYFYYDDMRRLTQTNYPDGGSEAISYNDAIPPSYTFTKVINSSTSFSETGLADTLGRESETELTSDPSGTTYTLTTYDPVGRKYQVYNPTRCSPPATNCGEATWGYTTYYYDPLNRVTSVVEQDNSVVSTGYTNNCTTVTDEALKARTSCVDGLGRMTEVLEDPGSSPHLNYETDYMYDALGNLLCADQQGGVTGTGCSSPSSDDPTSPWRVRRFQYDTLSRLTQATNPESGTINYSSYDADGDLLTRVAPRPNQTSSSVTETTNYSYDALNRLTQKAYAGIASPTVTFWYDGVAATGCTPPSIPEAQNLIGQRTAMCDGSGATSWSYDSMGRTQTEARTIGTRTASTQYAYYLDGSLQTIRYPSNYTVLNYTVSGAARVTMAQDATSGNTYVANATYFPNGTLSSDTMGGTINTQLTYNNRLQPLQMFYGTNTPNPGSMLGNTCPTTVGNVMHRVYGFAAGSSDNGNVLSILNCLDSNRNMSFSYDSLNRIESAATQGTTCSYCWGQLFGQMSGGQYVSGYDAWGNLHEITATQGSPTTLSQTVLPYNNRFSSMTYNADGSLKNDGAGDIYTYNDSEGRLTAAGGISYTYDADGMRVKKSGGTLYWRGTGSDPLVESPISGKTFTEEYIFFNGKRIARRDVSTGDVYYYFSDHLGSADTITNASGSIEEQSDYYPFGGEVVVAGSDPNTYKFTGKQRDTETGNDYFGARYYASNFGRFLTPDWAAKPTAVPYAHFGNPQSLNLYSYVQNNPTTTSDPDGHQEDLQSMQKLLQALRAPAGKAAGQVKGGLIQTVLEYTVTPTLGYLFGYNPMVARGGLKLAEYKLLAKVSSYEKGATMLGVGNPNQPGIDAVDITNARGVSLKESSNIERAKDAAVDALKSATNAGFHDVDLYIDVPSVSKTDATGLTKIQNVLGTGTIGKVVLFTQGGAVEYHPTPEQQKEIKESKPQQ